MNKEAKIVIASAIIINLVLFNLLYNHTNIVEEDKYLIIMAIGTIFCIYISVLKKSENLLWYSHVLFTMFIVASPFFIKTKPIALLYISIILLVFSAWIFNDDKCYITHMELSDEPIKKKNQQKKHFIRNEFMSKYKLSEIYLLTTLSYMGYFLL